MATAVTGFAAPSGTYAQAFGPTDRPCRVWRITNTGAAAVQVAAYPIHSQSPGQPADGFVGLVVPPGATEALGLVAGGEAGIREVWIKGIGDASTIDGGVIFG